MANILRGYHGSKNGIKGKIQPLSRATCDFGKGFYMGSTKQQPLGLVALPMYPHAQLYTLETDLTGLRAYTFQANLEWALFVAYNRQLVDFSQFPQLTALAARFQQINSMDVITGPIADDRMTMVLDMFFSAAITDTVLIQCMKAVNLGNQFTLKTVKACGQTTIIEQSSISPDVKARVQRENERTRKQMYQTIQQIQWQSAANGHRDGEFLPYILKHWKG